MLLLLLQMMKSFFFLFLILLLVLPLLLLLVLFLRDPMESSFFLFLSFCIFGSRCWMDRPDLLFYDFPSCHSLLSFVVVVVVIVGRSQILVVHDAHVFRAKLASIEKNGMSLRYRNRVARMRENIA